MSKPSLIDIGRVFVGERFRPQSDFSYGDAAMAEDWIDVPNECGETFIRAALDREDGAPSIDLAVGVVSFRLSLDEAERLAAALQTLARRAT